MGIEIKKIPTVETGSTAPVERSRSVASPAPLPVSVGSTTSASAPVSQPLEGKFAYRPTAQFKSLAARPTQEPVLALNIGPMTAREAIERVDEFGKRGLDSVQRVAANHPDVFPEFA